MSGTESKTALVIGASGGIGGETARALRARGWRIRALSRRPAEAARQAKALDGIEWVAGDAMDAAQVVLAARGASLIVHAANPPGYRDWAGTVLPMLRGTIAAAKATRARILFPGTIYNFGPDAFPVVNERSPQHPLTRKGALRAAMELELEHASQQGVRVLIVRAGDYFGTHAGNSWFGQGLISAGKPIRRIFYPGPREVGHSWAYLPDVAETIARLIEREDGLADFASFHFRGHWLARGVEMAEAIRRAAGNPRLPIRAFPWPAVALASPFVATFREMLEMRYLWREPIELDNTKLTRFLGREPHTPLDQAVRAALTGLGCLDGRGVAAAPAFAQASAVR